MPRWRLLAAAVGFAIVIVLGSPFAGALRVAIATALLAAFARIRDRRALRVLALGTALLAGALFARALSSGDPNTDVVEDFHFVEYGILTLLFYLAWRPIDDLSVLVLPLLAGLLVGTLDEW